MNLLQLPRLDLMLFLVSQTKPPTNKINYRDVTYTLVEFPIVSEYEELISPYDYRYWKNSGAIVYQKDVDVVVSYYKDVRREWERRINDIDTLIKFNTQ